MVSVGNKKYIHVKTRSLGLISPIFIQSLPKLSFQNKLLIVMFACLGTCLKLTVDGCTMEIIFANICSS